MKLKELRRKAALTQQEVADKIGISRVAVSQFELGQAKPKVETLVRLAEAFGVELQELLGLSAIEIINPSKKTTSDFHIVSRYPNPEADYVEIPFVSDDALSSFDATAHEPAGSFEKRRIRRVAGENYDNAYLIRLSGNAMAPVYPEGSEYVMRTVVESNWQYAQGVHALSLRNQMFLIRRIVSNQGGVVVLESDNGKARMSLELKDVLCMWEVGEGVYMPKQR